MARQFEVVSPVFRDPIRRTWLRFPIVVANFWTWERVYIKAWLQQPFESRRIRP